MKGLVGKGVPRDIAERFADGSRTAEELKNAAHRASQVERFGVGFESRAAIWAASPHPMEACLMTIDAVEDAFWQEALITNG